MGDPLRAQEQRGVDAPVAHRLSGRDLGAFPRVEVEEPDALLRPPLPEGGVGGGEVPAGNAPARAEIQHDDVPAQIREAEGRTRFRLERPVGRRNSGFDPPRVLIDDFFARRVEEVHTDRELVGREPRVDEDAPDLEGEGPAPVIRLPAEGAGQVVVDPDVPPHLRGSELGRPSPQHIAQDAADRLPAHEFQTAREFRLERLRVRERREDREGGVGHEMTGAPRDRPVTEPGQRLVAGRDVIAAPGQDERGRLGGRVARRRFGRP